jgi:hypothetical protein
MSSEEFELNVRWHTREKKRGVMNLGHAVPDLEAPLAPDDWRVSFVIDPQIEGGLSMTAVLLRRDTVICRFVLAGSAATEDECRAILTRKARMWIADYLARPHTGQTEFGDLH